MNIVYFLLCDDAGPDPANLHRYNVTGLLVHVRSRSKPPFPIILAQFCVLILVTGCQTDFDLAIQIVEAGTGRVIFRTPTRVIRFRGSLQHVHGARFRIQNCRFPAAGLYWVKSVVGGHIVARQPMYLS